MSRNYHDVLKEVVDEAPASVGLSREELERRIAEIGNIMKGPLPNAERIILAGERSSLRKAL